MMMIAGTETGQLKLVQCPDSNQASFPKILPFEPNAKSKLEQASNQFNQQCTTLFPVDKTKSILFMTTTMYQDTMILLLARKNGQVDLWDPHSHEILKTLTLFKKETNVTGFHMLNPSTVLASNDLGDIVIASITDPDQIQTLSLHCSIHSLRSSSSHPHVLAYGGKKNDLTILDLNSDVSFISSSFDSIKDSSKENTTINDTENHPTTLSTKKKLYQGYPKDSITTWNGQFNSTYLWKADNSKRDWLGLRIPIWITDLQFLNSECTRLATCTAYHEIKLYCTTQSPLPIRVLTKGEHPFRSMTLLGTESMILSDSKGTVTKLSLPHLKSLGDYKGATGAIYQVTFTPDQRSLITVGLDRMLRSYNLTTREMTGKWFLKQRLNCVLVYSFMNTNSCEPQTESRIHRSRKKSKRLNKESNQEHQDDEWELLKSIEKKRKKRKTIAAS